jgi:hypothetical protein
VRVWPQHLLRNKTPGRTLGLLVFFDDEAARAQPMTSKSRAIRDATLGSTTTYCSKQLGEEAPCAPEDNATTRWLPVFLLLEPVMEEPEHVSRKGVG